MICGHASLDHVTLSNILFLSIENILTNKNISFIERKNFNE